MNWYNSFNAAEAGLWMLVAAVIPFRAARVTTQQRFAVLLGSPAFLTFGVTDLMEIGREGSLPMWLWGLKVACGAAILSARYTWLGWSRFRWHDREVLFSAGCLAAVIAVIALQRQIEHR